MAQKRIRCMRYSKFIEEVKCEVRKELGESVGVVSYPVRKNNGAVYEGLVIMDNRVNVSPTIYLNPYYHRYIDGVSIEEIIEDILRVYKENIPTEDFDIKSFIEFDNAKEHIIMKLVNTERNEEFLKEVPSIPFYDLSLVFLVDVSKYMGDFATILIHDQHMKLWDVTVEDLYELAKENTPKHLVPRLDDLHDVYEYISGEELPFMKEVGIKILTNHLHIHGATCIAYPEILKELYSIIEGSFYIIPSSIHEVLIFPEKTMPDGYTLEDIDVMVRQVNKTEIKNEEVLSDHAYLFDGEKLIWEQEEIESQEE